MTLTVGLVEALGFVLVFCLFVSSVRVGSGFYGLPFV